MYCVAPSRLREEGILLENMICYANKGAGGDVPPSFYFIFTLKAEMITSCASDDAPWKLIKMSEDAPIDGGSRQLLDWAKSSAALDQGLGLDQKELERFAKRVVTMFTEEYAHKTIKNHKVLEGGTVPAALPACCELLRDVHEGFHRSLDIFDFSERKMMRRSVEVVKRVGGKELPVHFPVLPVGDALQEPFWPEGLGVNRGMHNSLDAVWVGSHWAGAQYSPEREEELVYTPLDARLVSSTL